MAVALQDLSAGTACDIAGVMVQLYEDVPAKQKFTLTSLNAGDAVYLYGVKVGCCTHTVPEGSLITTQNIEHAANDFTVRSVDYHWKPPEVSAWSSRTFEGYHRNDGSVGTANYWLVVPLVFCENRNLEVLDAALTEALGYAVPKDFALDTRSLVEKYRSGASQKEILEAQLVQDPHQAQQQRVFPNVDGIKFLKHQMGCGGTRQDAQLLCRLLAGYITHSNVAGATVLSLGCQNAQIDLLKEAIHKKDPNFSKPVHYLEQQASKNERSFIEEAIKKTFVGMMKANRQQRKPAPLSKLKLGLECGGSDGFSGISANPALGYTSDLLVALGGSAILSEFPELHGVEQELVQRCHHQDSAHKFVELMNTYAQRAAAVDSGFESNPSPGNIKDGLITDAIKSAGAAKKGGTSPITEVLDYGESVTMPGLSLLCTPGSDVESTTGLAGAGANLIVFTTGLGTPTGNPIVPVVKMSSNNTLYQRMSDIIDLNAGGIINGEDTIEGVGEQLLEYLIQVASGKEIPAAVRLRQDDFMPWKRGISL